MNPSVTGDVGYLHIWGQASEHDDVTIIGSEKALKALRDAIDAAIERTVAGAGTVFAADGEGYYATVICLNAPHVWRRLAVPYTDECSQETRDGALWPWHIIQVYDRLQPCGAVSRAALEAALGGDEHADNR